MKTRIQEFKKKKRKLWGSIDLRDELKKTSQLASKLNSKLLTLTKFRDEIQNEIYETEIKVLAIDINVLMQRLKTFLKT